MIQDDMKKLICPILSKQDCNDPFMEFVKCLGDRCMGFGSRPTYEYLGADSKTVQNHGRELKRFKRDDEGEELKSFLAEGWKKQNKIYTDSYLQREGEPTCWCDAMPANAQCGYEAP